MVGYRGRGEGGCIAYGNRVKKSMQPEKEKRERFLLYGKESSTGELISY